MKLRTKIIIVIVVVILGGIIGFGLWSYLGGQKVTWTTPTGEKRAVVVPKIPGMTLISEEKGDCFWKTNYVYELYKDRDLSDSISGQMKILFSKQDWILKNERIEDGFHILDFYTEKAGVYEIITLKLGFEGGKGTSFSLDYQWPPCSPH